MLITLKHKIKSEAVVVCIAILTLGTFIIDNLIMVFIRPDILAYCNTLANKKLKFSHADEINLMNLALFTQSYHIAVYHLLLIIMAFVVFFNRKFKDYKSELIYSYLIIGVSYVLIVAAHHLLNTKA